jgi:hypothetical protein
MISAATGGKPTNAHRRWLLLRLRREASREEYGTKSNDQD